MDIKRAYQQIPTELARYVFDKDLVKPFQVYMYLKCCNDSIVNKNSEEFRQMAAVLDFKSHNTVNKHLKKLLQLNWIGYNSISQNYFVRGIDKLRAKYGFYKRQSALFYLKDIQAMRAFLASVLVSSKIQGQKFYFEVVIRKRSKTAVKTTGAALQVATSSDSTQKWFPRKLINDKAITNSKKKPVDKPEYYGYCNRSIARILGCSKTTATELKQEMVRCGFIETVHHEKIIDVLEKRDYAYRHNLYKAYPELIGKVTFRVGLVKKLKNLRPKKVIEVVQQMYDEIIPKIKFTRVATKPSWFVNRVAA